MTKLPVFTISFESQIKSKNQINFDDFLFDFFPKILMNDLILIS
jgi:hypothetical protein